MSVNRILHRVQKSGSLQFAFEHNFTTTSSIFLQFSVIVTEQFVYKYVILSKLNIWPKISILCNYCCRLLINLDFCLNHVLYMCPPRAETQAARGLRHCFMALSISCWSILSHSLLWFLQKRHNYDTAQKHLTDSVKSNYHQLTCSIMDIRWKFHKICPNTVGNIWKTNISLFSEHGELFGAF